MAKQRDYYEILGVGRDASADQIRSAYRKLARQLHPDVNKAPDAAKRFGEVQEAYDVLSDQEKRKGYDQFGHAGVGAAGGQPRGGSEGWGPFGAGGPGRARTTWTNVEPGDFEGGDFSSIFEEMFGRTPGGGGGGGAGGGGGRGSPFGGGFGARPGDGGARARQSQPQRGEDIEHTIAVTFMTAALGGTEQLRIGAGNGGGASTINVKIPPGIEPGAKLRIKGKGQPSPTGGPRGDLILTIDVGNHPYFRREGLDLLIDLPITIAEAVLGVTVTAPLLTPPGGKASVELKVPPGSSSGRKLRVRGKGIANAAGKTGDYYAVVQIIAPKASDLSEDHRNSIEALASGLKNPRQSPPWSEL
jgi:curved DNA-binding protein